MKIQEIQDAIGCTLIINVISEMVRLSAEGGFMGTRNINGVTVMTCGDSDPQLVYRDQQRAQSGLIPKVVGPYPAKVLSGQDRANDEAQLKIAREEAARQRQKWQMEQDEKRQRVYARLSKAPMLDVLRPDLRDASIKVNAESVYGREIHAYAERWGRLMQLELQEGRSLESAADPTSSEADIDGITGQMHYAARAELANWWVHGEQLKQIMASK